MKLISILLFSSIAKLSAQCITFTYDAAGDRTARNICPQPLVSNTDKVLTTQIASWQEIDDADLVLSPNPSSGIVEIRSAILSADAEITLSDILGRVIPIHWSQGQNNIDLTGLQNGRYFLRVVDGRRYKVMMVVKN